VFSLGGAEGLLVLVVWGLGLLATYWIIRLAVRHALQDVAGGDRRPGIVSTPASRPAGRRPGQDGD
jgi:4-hydroxybenzoate polyprenyltransferase